jgi:small multidrug resistance family-3 protein
VLRSVALFLLAALAEIGGAWLVWQGVREQRGPLWVVAGVLALGTYGLRAALNPGLTSSARCSACAPPAARPGS